MTMRKIAMAGLFAGFVAIPAALAQQQPQFPDMTFFITSKPGPDGANFGGLEGADKHCQTLAAAAGAGARTWRAYLSTQGAGAINARDRIGKGPWKNVKGLVIASDLDDLHKDPRLNLDNSLTERGTKLAGSGYNNNVHDILTGSDAQGRALPADKDMTCGNWTKGGAEGSAMVGHEDRLGLNDSPPMHSWNSSHPTRGCSPATLATTGSGGLLYCFAAN
ncbi:MAG: hypothetical protein KGM42_11885 [Hyphomicrobiales bacterium]|nr:hypothetical protein [Hyphomicrobiales bacterium]